MKYQPKFESMEQEKEITVPFGVIGKLVDRAYPLASNYTESLVGNQVKMQLVTTGIRERERTELVNAFARSSRIRSSLIRPRTYSEQLLLEDKKRKHTREIATQ